MRRRRRGNPACTNAHIKIQCSRACRREAWRNYHQRLSTTINSLQRQTADVRQTNYDEPWHGRVNSPRQRPVKRDHDTYFKVSRCICVLHLFLSSKSKKVPHGDEGDSSWRAASLACANNRLRRYPESHAWAVWNRSALGSTFVSTQHDAVDACTLRQNHHTSGMLTARPGSPSGSPGGRDRAAAPSLPRTTPRARARHPG